MDQQKPFIIVVDDNAEDRYLLHYSFNEMGLDENVKFFGDALQFIKYTELISSLNVRPSLIILDYKKPYINGKGMVDYLKANAWFRNVPLVILTDSLTHDIRNQLLNIGVTACYIKGLNNEELITDLKDILKLVEAEENNNGL